HHEADRRSTPGGRRAEAGDIGNTHCFTTADGHVRQIDFYVCIGSGGREDHAIRSTGRSEVSAGECARICRERDPGRGTGGRSAETGDVRGGKGVAARERTIGEVDVEGRIRSTSRERHTLRHS